MKQMYGETTTDGFLDGRLQILQPVSGYRAATDPVFLAAAVEAEAGQSVLELGCGAAVASLCLGWRVSGLKLTGLELQPEYSDLAIENAARNGIDLRVVQGDLSALPQEITEQSFDHVMFNPPYFVAGAQTGPLDTGKLTAHVEATPLRNWMQVAFRRLKPRGFMACIHLAERLPDLLSSLPHEAGDVTIRPLAARVGRDAKRVIVTARKGSAGPTRLLAPFHIHHGAAHGVDGDDFSDFAREILRTGRSFAELARIA